MSKRLLFITCHKLSDNNGGANASKGFIHSFAPLFDDRTLIYLECEDIEKFIPEGYKLFPIHDARPKWQKGIDMYRGDLSIVCSFVRQHIVEHSYDIIVIDHSFTATSVVRQLKATGARIITIHHNVERSYLKDNKRPWLYRIPYHYYALEAERNSLLCSDVNITLTQKDADVFKTWYPERNLHLHPLGIVEYRNIPKKDFTGKDHAATEEGRESAEGNDTDCKAWQRETKGLTFAITGSLCFNQSNVPIIDFLNKYYPVLKEKCGGAQLVIAGRDPSKELRTICEKNPGVILIPNPIDIRKVISDADIYVCPIDKGSGLKLRILDGIKNGLPVLCHEVSACGYEHFVEKGMLFKYHDTDSFTKALNALSETKLSRDAIYNEYRDYFSVNSGMLRLKEILKEEGF